MGTIYLWPVFVWRKSGTRDNDNLIKLVLLPGKNAKQEVRVVGWIEGSTQYPNPTQK